MLAPFLRRSQRVLREELSGVHVRFYLVNLLLLAVPAYAGIRLRPLLYRLVGFRLARGVLIWGNMVCDGDGDFGPRLAVGRLSSISHSCFLNLNEAITIGENVVIAHSVKIITDDHLIGPEWRRAGRLVSRPVSIEDGAYIGAGAMILPGVTIGRGSVVAAGSVVTKNVLPSTMVGGVPAAPIKSLPASGYDQAWGLNPSVGDK